MNDSRLQRTCWRLLDDQSHSRAGRWVRGTLIGLIALNVVAFVLESDARWAAAHEPFFDALFVISLWVFTLEYALRLWCCVCDDHGLYHGALRGRLRYALTPLALLDLITLVPFWLGAVLGLDLRFLRLLRLLWLLRIARHLPALGVLGQVLRRERRTLLAIVVLLLVIVFFASSLVWLIERHSQPEHFASIPHAFWWGVTTLTTVGYGDMVPVTPLGRALGVLIMLLGIAMFALPAGVLASAFAEERKRHDFMQTWQLVAQVPVFAQLDARQIAGIAALLHPRHYAPGETVFLRDGEADSMYFIVSGQFEVELKTPVCLGPGEFFGEVALLYQRPRSASVVAASAGELLELEARDLHALFARYPQLRQRIEREAERRMQPLQTQADVDLETDSG